MGIVGKVITGGQTGADQGALRAAAVAGIETGGWIPKGWLTEDGPNPGLALFGLRETDSADYADRTRRNAQEADGIVWFGNPHSPGGICTMAAARKANIDTFTVLAKSTPSDVAEWVRLFLFDPDEQAPVRLMVAGNRESKQPGICATVERFMGHVFRLLSEDE